MLTLVLKESAREYLEQSKLEELVKKYSEFINFPIYLWTTKEVEREVPLEKTAEEAAEETEDLEVTETEEGEEEEAARKYQIHYSLSNVVTNSCYSQDSNHQGKCFWLGSNELS